ncbi:MAG: TrkH family potassium uptake protein [Bacteroidales bacterium]|nr:TrkH family potassium uptake protein [Bacteroidales bacterium]
MNRIIDLRIVLKVTSRNLFIIAIALLLCTGIATIYSENVLPFVFSSVISTIIGVLFYLLARKDKKEVILTKKDAYFTVTLSWLFIGLIGCLPYLFSKAIPNFTDAFFESVSGFTTTGSSILTDIEALPKSILFWRSLTHWIGGIGIIVLVIIVMPTLQIGGYNLFTLESSLQEKIQPKIKSVGYRLMFIYVLLTLAEVLLLLAGKMNLYESVCHAFGTIATGGFSPKNTSIAGYSPYIQYVVMIFMLLAGTNFVIHYYILKRSFKKVRNNEELKLYLFFILFIGLVITLALFFKMKKPFEESFRESYFQVISIITCTGYATADYMVWPKFAWIIIFFSMFLGGSTGSTAGGIKMARHLVLFKNVRRVFRQLISPNAIFTIRLNKKPINEEANSSILTFIAIYLLVFVVGSVSLIILGVNSQTASSAVATCMAGIGPGLGEIGPVGNFANIPEAGKGILTMAMLLGRLEIYTIVMLFTPYFWKK